jgi:DNA-directed RNA polymerase subunit RPC12/RpoP
MTYRETCSDECPDCGSRVYVGDAYCSSCGEPLEEAER